MTTNGTFTVGTQETFTETVSSQVTDAITFTQSDVLTIPTRAPGDPLNTVFYGLDQPTMNLIGNTNRLLFSFTQAQGIFTLSALALQNHQTGFDTNTDNQILAQYPPLTDPTGSTLTKPRFKKAFILKVDANTPPVPRQIVSATGTDFNPVLAATINAKVMQSTGFKDPALQQMFSTGEEITITQTSVQEVTSNKIVKFTYALSPPSGTHIFKIFRDKVFKTYVAIDAGLVVTSGQPVVTGSVTDSSGNPILGATVILTQGNLSFITTTDASGNYLIASHSIDPLSTGIFPISSGNVSSNVNVTNGMAVADLGGVDPSQATNTFLIDQTVYNLN